jgi:hypothetical protein
MNNINTLSVDTRFLPSDCRLLTETIVDVNIDGNRSAQQILQTYSLNFALFIDHNIKLLRIRASPSSSSSSSS